MGPGDVPCPRCGAPAAPGDRVCSGCGASLAPRVAPDAVTGGISPDAVTGGVLPDAGTFLSTPDQQAAAARASADPAGALFSPGKQIGTRYTIIKLLGRGGMGAVYQAWDDELMVAVAIKVILPDSTDDAGTRHDVEQ